MTNLPRSQLWQIVRAIEGMSRNPNVRATALKIIELRAAILGLNTDYILSAAGGLLDGSRSPEDFRKEIVESAAPAESTHINQVSASVNDTAGDVNDLRTEISLIRTQVDAIQDEVAKLRSKPSLKMKKMTRPGEETKTAKMIEMLRRPQGTTIHELAEMTGWKTQSVHGMMSGTLRKRLGINITSIQHNDGRQYYIESK